MSTYNMEKQHKLGKLHALERICMLLDEDSFREIGSNITNLEDAFNIKKGQFPYDGVITGYGTIGGQKVVIYSEDFTVIGGTLGKQHGFKIANAIKMAIESRCPDMVRFSTIIQWHPDTFRRFRLLPVTVPVVRFTHRVLPILSLSLMKSARCLLPDQKLSKA